MKRLGLLSVLSFVSVAHAYPIPPRTLWNLASEAQVVVVATLVEFRDAPEQPTSFAQAAEQQPRGGNSLARLRVVETLKGTPLKELDVVTNAGLMCPAPPRFVPGKQMVAFLSSYEGQWHVTALSYGVLYPSDDELPIFRSLLNRAVTLQQSAFTEAQRTEWAIEAASRRATRWHGVYELTSESDARHRRYDNKSRPPAKLTRAQQLALARGFIDEPSADQALIGIMGLLEGVDPPGLEQALVGAMDVLVEDEPSVAIGVLRVFITRKNGDPDTILGKREGRFDSSTDARKAWDTVRAKFSLPAGTKVPHREKLLVGEDTPN